MSPPAKSTKNPDLTASLATLNLTPASKPRPPPIADSWEDDLSSDDEASTSASTAPHTPSDPPQPPPPTPTTPTASRASTPASTPSAHTRTSSASSPAARVASPHTRTSSTGERERPATTDAVARRMISAALGVRAPRSTAEQREFDKAVREKEGRRRREEAERRREAERVQEEERRRVWED
ncbi:hypothetical protein EDC01DRAFT_780782 [Geopyxis carbonaria]|nr:hypothetical protein EDC01DRAFT_780782 [Geopyxis carbonaria]